MITVEEAKELPNGTIYYMAFTDYVEERTKRERDVIVAWAESWPHDLYLDRAEAEVAVETNRLLHRLQG